MKPLLLPAKRASVRLEELPDVSLAKREINIAWEQYKQSTIKHFKDGLEFGRSCHEWQAKYKAQGSRRGRGFEHLLQQLSIPKTTAYRWIRRYEVKTGLRANWNEIEDNALNRVAQRLTNCDDGQVRTCFNFFLPSERRQQFDEDVKTLGGRKAVARMFLEFVSQKAFEQRANAANERVGLGYKLIRHEVVGIGA